MRHHQAAPVDPPILTRAVVIPPACERSNVVPWLAALIAAGAAAIAGIGWITAKMDAARGAHTLKIQLVHDVDEELEPLCTMVFAPSVER